MCLPCRVGCSYVGCSYVGCSYVGCSYVGLCLKLVCARAGDELKILPAQVLSEKGSTLSSLSSSQWPSLLTFKLTLKLTLKLLLESGLLDLSSDTPRALTLSHMPLPKPSHHRTIDHLVHEVAGSGASRPHDLSHTHSHRRSKRAAHRRYKGGLALGCASSWTRRLQVEGGGEILGINHITGRVRLDHQTVRGEETAAQFAESLERRSRRGVAAELCRHIQASERVQRSMEYGAEENEGTEEVGIGVIVDLV